MTEAERWAWARRQIQSIAALEDDWDGEGAAKITADMIRATTALLDRIEADGRPAPMDIYPLLDGHIVMEWHRADGVIERIEVEGAGVGQKMTSYPDHRETEFAPATWLHQAEGGSSPQGQLKASTVSDTPAP